jgi:hypothetical protein
MSSNFVSYMIQFHVAHGNWRVERGSGKLRLGEPLHRRQPRPGHDRCRLGAVSHPQILEQHGVPTTGTIRSGSADTAIEAASGSRQSSASSSSSAESLGYKVESG